MTTVCIGTTEVSLDEARPPWLREQIQRRQKDDHPVCVRIKVVGPGVDITLPCGACGGGGGGGRRLTEAEREVVDRWRSRGLDAPDFEFGQLVAFLNSLR